MSSDDCVKVAVRVRPLVKSETSKGCQNIIEKLSEEPQIVVNKSDAFTFNYVFTPEVGQEYVYETAVKSLVERLFNGFNVTILAYGQTGSGKTHTMGTTFGGIMNSEAGVIPRAIKDIFKQMADMEEYTFSVACSFMELYQEQLYDLLSGNARDQCVVDIREDGSRGIVIPGLTETTVTTALETTDCLIRGSSGRVVGATAMNAQSSRSHAIFTVTIQMMKKGDTNTSTSSKFHLVDLAGSERSKKTKSTGDRFKEGVKINQGLLALGNVISALGGTQGSGGYIGYRDSKLTRLLQDSLGGNSLTLMIACISPADYNMDETLSTLRYADRAKKIKNKPVVNQDPKAAEINKLNGIIQKLRLELLNKGGSVGDSNISTHALEVMKTNLEFLSDKNRNLQQQLQATLNDVADIEMRAVVAETAYDELQQKMFEAKKLVFDLDNDIKDQFPQLNNKSNDIKTVFGEIDDLLKKNKEELLEHKKLSNSGNSSINQQGKESFSNTDGMQQKLEAFNSKQIDFTNELRRLNRELGLKEELHQKVAGNLTNLCTYDRDIGAQKMQEYESMIQILESEKTELNDKLKCVKDNASNKLSEERRKRLQQLEQQISDLRKKNLQQAKMLKMKEKESQKINNLNNEIQEMKAAKVKLIRGMRAESERFRQWKLNREKEVTQLKEKDRKRQNEMVRMESLHNKQKNVLKRKVEEATAINKRLKEAMDKQKAAQSHRKQFATGKVEHVLSWVDQELEVILSVIDAEYSLDQLMDDRAVLTTRLGNLKAMTSSNPHDISSLEEELQMRNAQISDLQQKVVASDIELKMKTICDGMSSMPEARAALKHLFSIITEMRKEYATKENKLEDVMSTYETAEEKIVSLENEKQNIEATFLEQMSTVEKNYEEKITVLLRELNTAPQITSGETTPDMSERLKIQQESLDKLDALREELEFYKNKCNEVETLLEKSKFKKPKSNVLARIKQEAAHVSDFSFTDTDNDLYDDDSDDPDWNTRPQKNVKTRSNLSKSDSREADSSKDISRNATKRSSDGSVRCSCKSGCATKICTCRKNSSACSISCKCTEACMNKSTKDENSRPNDDDDTNGNIENISETMESTPKKAKTSMHENELDVTTPSYPYSVKKRKPFYGTNM